MIAMNWMARIPAGMVGMACMCALPMATGDELELELKEESFPFTEDELGPLSADYFVVSGAFTVEEGEGGRVLSVSPEPLDEAGVLLGSSSRGIAQIEARFTAERVRRSVPQFAVGVYGIGGHRLRVSPATGELELVRNDEVVAKMDVEWESGEGYWLRLEASPTGSGGGMVQGWGWKDGEERPEEPSLSIEVESMRASGMVSVWGTPFSGRPILIDGISGAAEIPASEE
jgi:hypothetical protein